MLRYVLDEKSFYRLMASARSPVSMPTPLHAAIDGGTSGGLCAGRSASGLFGGNSNWRGPVWFPVNFLWVESLERYHHFYGDYLLVECPTGSGRAMNLI